MKKEKMKEYIKLLERSYDVQHTRLCEEVVRVQVMNRQIKELEEQVQALRKEGNGVWVRYTEALATALREKNMLAKQLDALKEEYNLLWQEAEANDRQK